MSESIYDIEVESIGGEKSNLGDYKDQVILIVNTASQCGFTPQYEGLENLHKKYKDQGLIVLGFPCNQFGAQEPGDASDIENFCQVNYGVSFPMHAKVDVNGGDAHPLFQHLKKAQKGVLGTEAIKWNFTKFLVNKNGEVVDRYSPNTKPEDMVGDIEKLL